MTPTDRRCPRCDATLSPWEDRCGCSGPRRPSHPEILYAIGCTVAGPLHVRDFVRIADSDYGHQLAVPTANATISPDPRFCWAGKGVYGLYRHGPLPGPRNLEEIAQLLLVAAGEPLTIEALDFCLKRIGYRYSVASLKNAINRSYRIKWHPDGRWDHPRGESAERQLRQQIPIVPIRRRAAWELLRDRLAESVREILRDRESRLRSLGDPSRFGFNWDPDSVSGVLSRSSGLIDRQPSRTTTS